MNPLLRSLAALLLATLVLPGYANAQVRQSLSSERDKVSYMVGMDIARSLAPAAGDIDLGAFERAVRNGLDGGKPLIDEQQAMATGQALMQRVAARSGRPVPGSEPPAVDKGKAGLLIGADIGRSLATLKDEIELPIVMQAVRTSLAGGKLLLTDAEAGAIRKTFGERMRVKLQAEAAQAGAKNVAEGKAFLAKNRQVKGMFTTSSGLQYMVLRQGAGRRPHPGDRVRVNYRGTLLDGSEFDSSYARGEAAEFSLDQVIAGWAEGLTLMPIGAKYRFWIPGSLAYGEKGNSGIGPNSTLVFDVELLDIL